MGGGGAGGATPFKETITPSDFGIGFNRFY